LLSSQRLRLIARMFTQMCAAVAFCHANGIAHRDIKPENFIVTEGEAEDGERRVVVKLTDFGLASRERESRDVDCGSAPYMSFECANNVAPTYATQPADVWSLGIVLINMLYHQNPWPRATLED
ncbi:Pkinase-domain-containing protein, partial [Calocera viscosa TUFC12733]